MGNHAIQSQIKYIYIKKKRGGKTKKKYIYIYV